MPMYVRTYMYVHSDILCPHLVYTTSMQVLQLLISNQQAPPNITAVYVNDDVSIYYL